MTIMKILVVDDEAPARKRLCRLVSEIEGYEVIAQAKNGEEAIQISLQQKPEIILMDIRMPGLDGLQAAAEIMQQDIAPAVIYCTAYSDHAIKAFETHAIDYLLKPVDKNRLEEALQSASKMNRAQVNRQQLTVQPDGSNRREHICARVRGNLVLVPVDDIFYFQAEQKYITVRHTQGELLIEETLLSLQQEFADSFLRIHRNALVALNRINGLEKSENSGMLLSFNEIDDKLEVSRRHLPSVRKIIKNL